MSNTYTYRFIKKSEESIADSEGYPKGNHSEFEDLICVDKLDTDTGDHGLATPTKPAWITAPDWPFASLVEACPVICSANWGTDE